MDGGVSRSNERKGERERESVSERNSERVRGGSRGGTGGKGCEERNPSQRREERSALTLSPPGAAESGVGPVRGVLATVADRRRAILCVF